MYKIILMLVIMATDIFGQHTFSIVAVDTITGYVGSAGASCLDTTYSHNINKINELVPGKGAIVAQAAWDFTNLANAKKRMLAGDSPTKILEWLKKNDSNKNHQRMQYGIVDLDNNTPRSIAFSGTKAWDYKNHIIGRNYAVQGNVLIGHQTLDSIEAGFLNETSTFFGDKLISALLGAAFAGADKRCLTEGVSSRSAYIRMAKPSDSENKYFLDLYIGATPYGVEPINRLKNKYDEWQATQILKKNYLYNLPAQITHMKIRRSSILVTFSSIVPNHAKIINFLGQSLPSKYNCIEQSININFSQYINGVYFLQFFKDNTIIGTKQITIIQ